MKTFRLGCIWVPLVLEQVVCLTPGPPEDVPEVRQTPHTSNHLSLCETEVSALWGVWNAVLRTKSKYLGNKCDICFRQVLGLNLLLLVVCVWLHVHSGNKPVDVLETVCESLWSSRNLSIFTSSSVNLIHQFYCYYNELQGKTDHELSRNLTKTVYLYK